MRRLNVEFPDPFKGPLAPFRMAWSLRATHRQGGWMEREGSNTTVYLLVPYTTTRVDVENGETIRSSVGMVCTFTETIVPEVPPDPGLILDYLP